MQPNIEDLPTEILHQIALHVAYPFGQSASDDLDGPRYLDESGDIGNPSYLEKPSDPDEIAHLEHLCNLRLTSRTIQAKTQHAFAQVAFHTRTVDFSVHGLRALQHISFHPSFGPAVRTLFIVRHEISNRELSQLRDAAQHDEEDEFPPVEAIEDLREAEMHLRDLSYLERCGTATGKLASVLFGLPNVKHIHIIPVAKVDHHNMQVSPTVLVPALLAAISLSRIHLHSLTMASMYFGYLPGLPIDVLDCPRHYFSRFKELRELCLVVSPAENYSNAGSLTRFLLSLPSLVKLDILLDTFLQPKSVLDDYLIRSPPLNTLQEFCLEGARLCLRHDTKFLGYHAKTLKTLRMRNCNLDYHSEDKDQVCGWRQILKQLQEFPSLRVLELCQLAENTMRTAYPNQGIVFDIDLYEPDGGNLEHGVLVFAPRLHHVLVEPWEDMSARLQQLHDAFTVTQKPFHSDNRSVPAKHVWYHPWM